jgi:hypothetical protein
MNDGSFGFRLLRFHWLQWSQQVACEEEVVLGSDSEGVAHEGGSVDNEGTGHRASSHAT